MIIKINPRKPEKEIIRMAAKIIKDGGLVVFPTETVYGLGANALDKKAVRKIFKVKKRPMDNPLIVHIANFDDLKKVAREIPKIAKILAKKFWPGPLTLVLKKREIIPNEVTGGGDTVAVRMPKNKIALALIKAAKVPIAAPSANLAGKPSATTARDVFEDFKEKVNLILDGGKTEIGLESTVLDLTSFPPQILRPGALSFEILKKELKELKLHPLLEGKKLKEKVIKSPGMKYRHYAPKATLILVGGKIRAQIKKIKNLILKFKKKKKKVGVLSSEETKKFYKNADLVLTVGSRKNLKTVAKNLFQTLREFDRRGVDIILSESFPEKNIGFALMHRLKKAAKSKLENKN